MTAYVLFLRGINVGGKNRMPMQELRSLLSGLGCETVSSYIQSGNAVLQDKRSAADLGPLIAAAISAKNGFEPEILLLDSDRFNKVLAANPFLNEMSDPRHVHVWFPTQAASEVDVPKMESLATKDEKFALREGAFYLYAPAGIGRSKLAARAERCLGVSATARNWRTVSKMAEMLAALN